MKRLMIIDDEKIDRMLFECIFEDTYQVLSCKNGKEALNKLRHQPVDLVITDLQMMDMDGIELTRKVRQKYPKLPVIAVTAKPEYFDLNVNLAALFDDFLAKPLNISILEEKVRRHIEPDSFHDTKNR